MPTVLAVSLSVSLASLSNYIVSIYAYKSYIIVGAAAKLYLLALLIARFASGPGLCFAFFLSRKVSPQL